jgi:Tfp pilus assembly PilM family ATPase
MARSSPPDVLVLDSDRLLHARIARGRKNPQVVEAQTYAVREGVFTPAVVTPELADPSGLAEAVDRMRMESRRWDRASLLLPDSWFRINLVDLPSLPERGEEALHAVRWGLKRTLPIPPESLRIAWEVLYKSATGLKVLVIVAVEKTLAAIESVFTAAGIEIVIVEPLGLNIWNAITAREVSTSSDRLFVYVRDGDFTTALFRGSQPMFVRSRNLTAQRTLQQEIRLSAGYLRDTVETLSIERAYVAGRDEGGQIQTALEAEFSAPVVPVLLSDFIARVPPDLPPSLDAELTACTGVFTA